MASLGSNRYGKQHVRVLRKHLSGSTQSVVEISADVLVEGSFDKAFLGPDNSQIVATDTIKNTVIALAHEHLGPCIEDFALVLGRHFLDRHRGIDRAAIELRERVWERLSIQGKPAAHSFHAPGLGEPFTRLEITRVGAELRSGVRHLVLLNSTSSGFAGFDRTEFTTLADTDDRILSTELDATWRFLEEDAIYREANSRARDALLSVFANNASPSVQRTLFEMGQAALEAVPEISEITLRLPNRHYFPADLTPFGITNPNLTFLPQAEPHGQIEAVIHR